MIKKIWVAYHLHKIVPEIPVRLRVEHDILVRSTGKFLGAATAICLILACKVAIAGWRVTCDQPYFSLELPFRFLSKEKCKILACFPYCCSVCVKLVCFSASLAFS